MNKRLIFFSGCILLSLLLFSFRKDKHPDPIDGKFVVVLDAGHGGHDPGNLGNGYLEKNIALKIVLQVGAILEKDPSIKVVYTRHDDTFVDLFKRGEIANKANADVFVSVHCDSHNSDAHGAGTFVLGLHANKQNFEVAKKENSVIYLESDYQSRYSQYDINSPESVIGLTIMQEEFLDQSIMLAKMMQENFSGKLKRTDRKVKQAGFIVLHQTFMPSVLVESGFLTNKEEGAYLNSKKGQAEMGGAIADAIEKYRAEIQGNTVKSQPRTTEEPPAPKEVVQKNEEVVVQTEKKPEETPKQDAVVPVVKAVEKPKETTKEETAEAPKNTPSATETASAENDLEKQLMKVDKDAIVFKVQLMASSHDLPLQSESFKGLNTLSKEPYNKLFRYMYGNTHSYFQAKLFKSNADAKGYTSSYIVAYKDGKRISLSEAANYADQ